MINCQLRVFFYCTNSLFAIFRHQSQKSQFRTFMVLRITLKMNRHRKPRQKYNFISRIKLVLRYYRNAHLFCIFKTRQNTSKLPNTPNRHLKQRKLRRYKKSHFNRFLINRLICRLQK